MKIIPSTDSSAASIDVSDEQAKRIQKITPSVFIKDVEFPKHMRLKISDDEALTEQGRKNVRDGILKID